MEQRATLGDRSLLPHSTIVHENLSANFNFGAVGSAITTCDNDTANVMNDNMLEISRVLANPKRSNRDIPQDYNEDDINFYSNLKKRLHDEMKTE